MSHKRKEAPSSGGDLAAAVEAARHAASARNATIWRESGPQQAAEINYGTAEDAAEVLVSRGACYYYLLLLGPGQ